MYILEGAKDDEQEGEEKLEGNIKFEKGIEEVSRYNHMITTENGMKNVQVLPKASDQLAIRNEDVD